MKVLYFFSVAFLLGVATSNMEMKEEKDRIWTKWFERGVIGRERTSVKNSPQKCVNGSLTVAGEAFPCNNVDFLSYTSLQEMNITARPHMSTGTRASDIWGWQSASGKEYTIICLDNGVAFVDTTNPVTPCTVATLASPRPADTWCDIKVYKDTAYIIKDTRGGDSEDNKNIGGQVFDMLRLEPLGCPAKPIEVNHDYLWDYMGSAHNLAINTETGYLYAVGGDYCKGGMMIIDLNKDRLKPEFVFCVDGDNYTHDAQCVIYRGPDVRYQGREICFAFNEDTLTIWDVDYKYAPAMLSRMTYPGQVYCHQGWLLEDMATVLMDDELNELCNGVPEEQQLNWCKITQQPLDGNILTTTLVVDVSDLTNPIYKGRFEHQDAVVDHNLYLWGPIHKHGWGGNPPLVDYPNPNYAYLHNYLSGLRVLDVSGVLPNTFNEVAYFDCAPDLEELTFLGSWSGYLHPSGAYAISSVERGLFMVNMTLAFDNVVRTPTTEDDDSASGILTATGVILLLAGIALMVYGGTKFYKRNTQSVPVQEKPHGTINPSFQEPENAKLVQAEL